MEEAGKTDTFRSQTVIVATYSQVPELYELSSSLLNLPVEAGRVRLTDWHAKTHIVDLLRLEADWIIHIDEDAFVMESAEIEKLRRFMFEKGYVCCGVPDGGVIEHRFHNPIACNPAFMIIHRRALLDTLAKDPAPADERWSDGYRAFMSPLVSQRGHAYAFDEYEPFYGFFFWLCKHRMPILYLDAEQWPEEPERITTLVKGLGGKPFLLHSWHSRDYVRKRPPLATVARRVAKELWSLRPFGRRGPHYNRIRRVVSAVQAMRQQQIHSESADQRVNPEPQKQRAEPR